VAWGMHYMKLVKILGDNRFMLEFDSAETRKRVIEGGPWRHCGDALLVVEYDGLLPPSTIVMKYIGIWARFYDLPDVLRKEEHASRLGAQLGQVIIVNMSYPNYVRVRVRFPLANALVASMKVCIKGRGDIVVPIWYENVPFFCFFYGRIGHSDKECPDGEIGVGEVKFGVELRASLKRIHEVRIPVRREAARFLNFEGSQRTKLQDEASSVRDVISPDGSPDRFPDPRRALIGAACRFVAVGPPLAQRHIKERLVGAREPTFTMPSAPPQILT
jgi:hypothetical protein